MSGNWGGHALVLLLVLSMIALAGCWYELAGEAAYEGYKEIKKEEAAKNADG
jgi:hypothetical protein